MTRNTTTIERMSVDISVDCRRLKYLRQRVGMSGRALAAAVRVDPSAICRYSSGERMPSVLTLTRLCMVLGVPYFDVVTVTEAMPAKPPAQKRPRTAATSPSGTSSQSASPTTTGKAGSSPATA
jgi:transcriptional regulator with XRE-family HTH domain